MKTHPVRSPLFGTALLALGCAFCATFVQLPMVKAADAAALQPLADHAGKVPLTATFEKKAAGTEGPQYVLNLMNTSKADVKASAEVHLSVVVHNTDKVRKVPAHMVAVGATWTIPELSSLDKVVVSAEGFEPLELTVP